MIWTIAKKLQDLGDWTYIRILNALGGRVSPELIERYMKTGSLEHIFNLVWWCYLGRNIPPQFNTLLEVPGIESGKVRWFGKALNRVKSDPILVMFHGGAYCLDMTRNHAMAMKELWDTVGNPRLSIVCLDYTVASEARWPKQLEEATALYIKLLEIGDNIIAMGDSAGGHLSLFLSREATKRGLPKPSLVLVSPWLVLVPDIEQVPDWIKNDTRDISNPYLGAFYGAKAMPLDKSDPAYEAANLLALDWDEYLPSPDRIFVSYGEYEVLRVSILEFLKETDLQHKGATVYTEPHGIHVSYWFNGCGPWRIGLNPVIEEISHFIKRLGTANNNQVR